MVEVPEGRGGWAQYVVNLADALKGVLPERLDEWAAVQVPAIRRAPQVFRHKAVRAVVDYAEVHDRVAPQCIVDVLKPSQQTAAQSSNQPATDVVGQTMQRSNDPDPAPPKQVSSILRGLLQDLEATDLRDLDTVLEYESTKKRVVKLTPEENLEWETAKARKREGR